MQYAQANTGDGGTDANFQVQYVHLLNSANTNILPCMDGSTYPSTSGWTVTGEPLTGKSCDGGNQFNMWTCTNNAGCWYFGDTHTIARATPITASDDVASVQIQFQGTAWGSNFDVYSVDENGNDLELCGTWPSSHATATATVDVTSCDLNAVLNPCVRRRLRVKDRGLRMLLEC